MSETQTGDSPYIEGKQAEFNVGEGGQTVEGTEAKYNVVEGENSNFIISASLVKQLFDLAQTANRTDLAEKILEIPMLTYNFGRIPTTGNDSTFIGHSAGEVYESLTASQLTFKDIKNSR